MIWSKTFAKLGWFLVFIVAGALADAAVSPWLQSLVGANVFAHSALPLIALGLRAFQDWWKHREPKEAPAG